MASKNLQRLGEATFAKVDKVVWSSSPSIVRFLEALTQKNSELFTLTYGALVMQLLKDYEDVEEVNKALEKM
jgi:hypothetical protein